MSETYTLGQSYKRRAGSRPTTVCHEPSISFRHYAALDCEVQEREREAGKLINECPMDVVPPRDHPLRCHFVNTKPRQGLRAEPPCTAGGRRRYQRDREQTHGPTP